MDALYAQAAYCTAGEERARALLESVRAMAAGDETNKWVQLATSLCQQAVFELETHAIVVDGQIEAGGDLSDVTPYVCQPLETLEALEEGFVVLNSADDMKLWTLFMGAVDKGGVARVDLLILAGVNPAAGENWAIQAASYDGHLSVVNRLLQDRRVDPTAMKNYAIRVASKNGHLSIVNRLLQDKRVDPSVEENDALVDASRRGHLPVVDRLLRDARVDPSGAFRTASYKGHLAVVDRLLQDERVDPSTDNNSAFRGASYNGHFPVVERLLRDKRVDPTARDNWAIRQASQLEEVGHMSIIKRLLQDERVCSTLCDIRLARFRLLVSQSKY